VKLSIEMGTSTEVPTTAELTVPRVTVWAVTFRETLKTIHASIKILTLIMKAIF